MICRPRSHSVSSRLSKKVDRGDLLGSKDGDGKEAGT